MFQPVIDVVLLNIQYLLDFFFRKNINNMLSFSKLIVSAFYSGDF